MSATLDSLDDVARRIRAEYREMPGLNLTARQAARLWSLDQATSESLLDSLTETGFLYRAESGTYVLLERRGPGHAVATARLTEHAHLVGAAPAFLCKEKTP